MKPTTLLILLGILAPVLPAQADLASVQRQIDALRREIAAERQMLETELARRSASDRGSRTRLADMRDQTRRARVEADSLRSVLAVQGRPDRDQAAEQKRLQDWNRRLSLALAGQVDSAVAKLAREELPYYADPKVRALKDLSRGLRAGVIPPEQGLGQALDHLSEVLSWSSKVEAQAGSYTNLAGAPLIGYYVRVGGVFEGFVTEDGRTGAYRVKTPDGWAWKESLTAERRDNLLKMSRMLLAGEQPGFVPVPFGLASGGLP